MTRELATQYLTRKVAQILYDTVECALPDRSLSDWTEAERIVREHLGYLLDEWGYLDGLPATPTFEDWDARLGADVWRNVQSLRETLPRPPSGSVTFQ